VHDVAFPRLNSAAFWFLPAGLLMLCQLVCLDRRYQRMNCFNIREVEALLKGRFFPDLIQSYDHRLVLNNSVLALRFKQPNLSVLSNANLLFQSFGLNLASSRRSTNFDLYSSTSPETYPVLSLSSISASTIDTWLYVLDTSRKQLPHFFLDSLRFVTQHFTNTTTQTPLCLSTVCVISTLYRKLSDPL
jgi:hypothetical protein